MSRITFLILFIVISSPVLLNKYFPSEDGQVHVQTAKALLDYNDPEAYIYKEYYQKNTDPEPNTLVYWILVILMLFFKPVLAEKVLILLYILFFLSSFFYLHSKIFKVRSFVILLIYPFVLSYTLHLGFYNYSFSIPVFFLTYGYLIDHITNLSWRDVFVLLLLSIVLFFFHAISLGVFYIVLFATSLWYIIIDKEKNNYNIKNIYTSSSFILISKIFAIVIPSVILLVLFIDRQGSLYAPHFIVRSRLINFSLLSTLFSYSIIELILSVSLMSVILLLSTIGLYHRIRNPSLHRKDDYLLFSSILLFLVYLFLPTEIAGAGWITFRMMAFPLYFLILWLSGINFSTRIRRITSPTIIAIILAFSIIHNIKYKELNSYIKEYTSCSEYIASNSVILHISGSHQGLMQSGKLVSEKVAPFLNIGSRINYIKPVIDLSNYMGWTGYGMLDFKEEVDPSLHLHSVDRPYFAGSKNINGYIDNTSGTLNYIILWQYNSDKPSYGHIRNRLIRTESQPESDVINEVRSQIKSRYKLLYTSNQEHLELYELKE